MDGTRRKSFIMFRYYNLEWKGANLNAAGLQMPFYPSLTRNIGLSQSAQMFRIHLQQSNVIPAGQSMYNVIILRSMRYYYYLLSFGDSEKSRFEYFQNAVSMTWTHIYQFLWLELIYQFLWLELIYIYLINMFYYSKRLWYLLLQNIPSILWKWTLWTVQLSKLVSYRAYYY